MYVEQLITGYGGWILYRTTRSDLLIYCRLTESEGRLEVTELYLAGAPIRTSTLRQVPVAQIEAMVNEPHRADRIRKLLELPGPDLRTAAGYFASTFGDRQNNWVARSRRSQSDASTEPSVAPPPLSPLPSEPSRQPAIDLQAPDQSPYPDEFYRSVAEVYAKLAGRTSRPAKEMAEASGVPVTTIRRWVKKARQKGYLPPGKQGRAG